jgi:N-acetylneuraminic acid mutarotase
MTSTPPATIPPAPTAPPATTSSLRWAPIAAGDGPTAREDHTWTVDGDGRAAWLFGGRDGATVFGDLWRYDLATDRWQRIRAAGEPAPRFGHTATLVPDVGLVIFGGQAGGGFFNDLWAYDAGADTWTRLAGGGATPEPRYGTCAGLAPDGRLWISHGFTDQGRFYDQRAYDFATQTWANVSREDPVPVIRCLHDCVWTGDGRFVLYGGQTNGVAALGDLWTRTVDGPWIAQPAPPLAARQLYALTVAGDVAWVFGGADVEHKALDDLWTLDLGSLAWQRVTVAGSGPLARRSATLVADPARNRLLLFGGRNSATAFGDLWALALPAA